MTYKDRRTRSWSFEDKGVPKLELGTEGGGTPALQLRAATVIDRYRSTRMVGTVRCAVTPQGGSAAPRAMGMTGRSARST